MDDPEIINPDELLKELRWDVDRIVISPTYGERYWLKECVVDGKRIGITDCCPADDPCEYHASLTHPAISQRQ